MIGQIFVLFTGMFDIATQKDINGGYRKIQDVDIFLRNIYQDDDEVPYFEAVYMAFFIYFMVVQGTRRVSQEENIYYYMDKNLKLQERLYSENSSAVLKTLITLAGIDARKGQIKKAKAMVKRIKEIEKNLPKAC